MTQDDYVVMKKSSREKLIKELKECKKENQQLKKQKDDVVEYIKNNNLYHIEEHTITPTSTKSYIETERYIVSHKNILLRMLGEIDD